MGHTVTVGTKEYQRLVEQKRLFDQIPQNQQ